MAVGEKPNRSHQDPNILPYVHAVAMNMMQQSANKTQHNKYAGDEQTVPNSLYRQEQAESYNFQDYVLDPLTNYDQFYSSTYPLNHNVAAYPMLHEPDISYNTSPVQLQGALSDERAASVARQVSHPYDTDFLEEYINNHYLDYDLNDSTGFDNVNNFTLEDYVDLEKVNFPEEESINFEVVVKQEKADENNNGNVDKMENILNNTAGNTNNNEWSVYNNYPHNMTVPTVAGSDQLDQTLEEPNNLNFTDILGDFYPSPNSEGRQAEQLGSSSQLSMVSEQFMVKTEPDESVQSRCQLMLQENDSYNVESSGLSVSKEELIEMPVSRFNEFITSLTQEQCNLVKDIRRRGKNKKAAKLCRKRKIDNISTLGQTITEMEDEKDRLLEERNQIVSETDELKRNIDSICEIVIKGLNSENVISSSDISVLHHSNGQTLLVENNN